MNTSCPAETLAALTRANGCCQLYFNSSEHDMARLFSSPLLEEWEALAKRLKVVPFLQPGWLLAWWRAFGKSTQTLAIWTLYNKGRLAAVLPLVQQQGCLRSATNWHTPQSGFLAENAQAASALLRAVLIDGGARHVILEGIDPLGPDAGIYSRTVRTTGHGSLFRPHERACFLELNGSWENYAAGLSKNLSSDLRRCRHRLDDVGHWSCDVDTGRENLFELLEAAFTVEAAGWKRSRGTAIVSSPDTSRFYNDIAGWAADANMLRVFMLRLRGRPLAMLFALEHRGVMHLLKGGYDESFAHCSPGKLLMHECIRHCFHTGLTKIEFHGNPEPYKLRWQPAFRDLQRFHAFPATAPGYLTWACVKLRPRVKSLLALLNPQATPLPVDGINAHVNNQQWR